MNKPIKELAEDWLCLDKDPQTRDEIYKLLVQNDLAELETRLRHRIAFGTAGLRGPMKAGFSCMNSLTVIQASQGLAAYLLENGSDAKHRGVVIGYDARYNSEKFAKLAAAAFVAKKIKVWFYETTVHTPLVPFGVGELGAAAGIMVTASHNPAQDNGYKVYWANGCQIIPPHDSGIAAAILKNLEPVTWDTSVVDEGHLLVEGALGLVEDAYFKAVISAAQPEYQPIPDMTNIKFVYTPMHGVGLPAMTKTARNLGVEQNMVVVTAQAEPNPDFPTVKFPNPEEKGALDLAIQAADSNSITLILASDPDADRLAVAEKVNGQWHQLTGNQLGILLASYAISTYQSSELLEDMAMLASTVSSRMLSVVARNVGFHFTETLTGFKWLGNRALDLESDGYTVAFAFEEAIGYMIPSVVHDKDSISAAAVFLSAVATWQNHEHLTPFEKLQQLYKEHGYFADANTYLVSPSPTTTTSVFASIRGLSSSSKPFPTHLGPLRILTWRDLTLGFDSTTADNIPVLPVSKDSEMITCEVEGDVRFTVRASGTEPKIKMYIECGPAKSEEAAKKGAENVQKLLLDEWFGRDKSWGLRLG